MKSDRNDEDALRRLAYNLWLERGRPLGTPDIDWARAEQLLKQSGRHEMPAGGLDVRDDGIMDGSAEEMMVPAVTELAREASERDPAGGTSRRRGARP